MICSGCTGEIRNVEPWLADLADWTCQTCSAGPKPVVLKPPVERMPPGRRTAERSKLRALIAAEIEAKEDRK